MKKSIPVLVILVSLSCSSNYPILTDTVNSEAETLQGYCKEMGIESAEIKTADSLLDSAKSIKAKGNDKNSFWIFQTAATSYKLAISKHELSQSQEKVKELEKTLGDVEEQLKKYKEVLRELEKMRKP